MLPKGWIPVLVLLAGGGGGGHIVDTGESPLISVIMNQSEVWVSTTEKEMNLLESLDLILLSRALKSIKTVNLCVMILEMGMLPVRFFVLM